MALRAELRQPPGQWVFLRTEMGTVRAHKNAILQTKAFGVRNIECQRQTIRPMRLDVKAAVQRTLAKMRERFVQDRNLMEQKGRTTGAATSAAADPAMQKVVALDVLAVRSSDSARPSTASL